MSIDPTAELARFHEFIASHVAKGGRLTPEEALDLWRAKHPSPDDAADTVQALRDALTDMEAGDCGVPLEEFDRTFRQRHGLPPS
jgi:hypothetical protein